MSGDRLIASASLIVQLVDDFSGRLITDGSVRVSIAGQKPPLRKKDGFFVFMNLPNGLAVTVNAEGGVYEPECTAAVAGRNADGAVHTLRMRMTPGRAYPVPADATRIEGTAEAGCAVRITCRKAAHAMKLLYDYAPEQERAISIFHSPAEDLIGRLLLIDDGKNSEYFQVSVQGEEAGDYRLVAPLSRAYKKIGTSIYPVYSANADGAGRFYIPIAGLREKEYLFSCTALGSRQVDLEAVLKTGMSHRLDLTGGSGGTT